MQIKKSKSKSKSIDSASKSAWSASPYTESD